MNKFSRVLLAAVLLLVMAAPVTGGQAAASQSISVFIDGQPLYTDPPPMIEDGRTLVPFRAFFEALGADVTWDPEQRRVIGVHLGLSRSVGLIIDFHEAAVIHDGEERVVTLDVPPRIVAGRTFVPLRFVGESLGADVDWDPHTRTITVTSADAPKPPDQNRYVREEHPGFVMNYPQGWQLEYEDGDYGVGWSAPDGTRFEMLFEDQVQNGLRYDTTRDMYEEQKWYLDQMGYIVTGEYEDDMNGYQLLHLDAVSPDGSEQVWMGVVQRQDGDFHAFWLWYDPETTEERLPDLQVILTSFTPIY